jgi:hypothetical protein
MACLRWSNCRRWEHIHAISHNLNIIFPILLRTCYSSIITEMVHETGPYSNHVVWNIAGKAAILLLMIIAYSPSCYLLYFYGEAIVGVGNIFMQLLII